MHYVVSSYNWAEWKQRNKNIFQKETCTENLSFILSCEAVSFFVADILIRNTDIWPTVETVVSAL